MLFRSCLTRQRDRLSSLLKRSKSKRMIHEVADPLDPIYRAQAHNCCWSSFYVCPCSIEKPENSSVPWRRTTPKEINLISRINFVRTMKRGPRSNRGTVISDKASPSAPADEIPIATARLVTDETPANNTNGTTGPVSTQPAKKWLRIVGIALAFLLVIMGATVGIVCGATKICKPSQLSTSETQNIQAPNSASSMPTTPSPTTASPTTASPTGSPVSAAEKRAMNLVATVNNVSLSAGTLRYPLPSDPTPEEKALAWLIDDDPAQLSADLSPLIQSILQRFVLASIWFQSPSPLVLPIEDDLWMTEASECEWQSISCNALNVVTRIWSYALEPVNGRLTPEIGLLTSMTELTARNLGLAGNIPTTLGMLTALTDLDFDGNDFTGRIPTELGALTALEDLDLASNKLVGPIPTEIGLLTLLSRLWASSNDIGGSIPSEIGSMTSLQHLSLYSNVLTGKIPDGIGALTRLTDMTLFSNSLTGVIPTVIGSCQALTSLWVNNNFLVGSLPSALASLRNWMNSLPTRTCSRAQYPLTWDPSHL